MTVFFLIEIPLKILNILEQQTIRIENTMKLNHFNVEHKSIFLFFVNYNLKN